MKLNSPFQDQIINQYLFLRALERCTKEHTHQSTRALFEHMPYHTKACSLIGEFIAAHLQQRVKEFPNKDIRELLLKCNTSAQAQIKVVVKILENHGSNNKLTCLVDKTVIEILMFLSESESVMNHAEYSSLVRQSYQLLERKMFPCQSPQPTTTLLEYAS